MGQSGKPLSINYSVGKRVVRSAFLEIGLLHCGRACSRLGQGERSLPVYDDMLLSCVVGLSALWCSSLWGRIVKSYHVLVVGLAVVVYAVVFRGDLWGRV